MYYLTIIMINWNVLKLILTFTGFALLQLPDLMCYIRTRSEDWLRKLALSVRRIIDYVLKSPFLHHNEDNDCNIA